MSNPTTGFTSNGVDLSNIFLSISYGSSIGYNTGFTFNDQGIRKDLGIIFSDISNNISIQNGKLKIPNKTNLNIFGYDLRDIFAPYNTTIFNTMGSTDIMYNYNSTNYTFIRFLSSTTSGSVTFKNVPPNFTVNYLLVGGGGAGGTGVKISIFVTTTGSRTDYFYTGGGGGGGEVKTGSFNPSNNSNVNITVGRGGDITDSTNTGNGYYSRIQYNSINIYANGGNVGGSSTFTNNFNITGGAAINKSGKGGDGEFVIGYSETLTSTISDPSGSSDYDSSLYQSITLNTYTFPNPVSGGGAPGTTITSNASPNKAFSQTGSGGSGGYYVNSSRSYISPTAGIYGGGGGGGYAYNPPLPVPVPNVCNGAKGGDGLIILWFKSYF